jgi:hemerythrin superfamily protein
MSTTPYQPSEPSSSFGKTPEEIEREIDQTRDQLNRMLGELESKLSPRERLRAAAASAQEFGQRITRSAGQSFGITAMIRMDHTHVQALFRRFRPGTSATRRQALAKNACLALEIHAQLEEEIFYPALRAVAIENPILAKSEPEHDEMRRLIGVIRSLEVEDPAYDRTMRELMGVVLHHVADEESKLLPLAETLLADRLRSLGREMTKRRIELLRPHLGEVARTTALSFPLAATAGVAALLAVAWAVSRPGRQRRRAHSLRALMRR